jgi:hypothetical protein
MAELRIVTGDCGQVTQYEARIREAEWAQEEGRYRAALEWRAVAARVRREGWGDKPFGGPREGPIFWHEARRDDTVVCPCGHFSRFLCDEPIGKGRTCDAPMCLCCRHEIGPELDQCDFHSKTRPREMTPATIGED